MEVSQDFMDSPHSVLFTEMLFKSIRELILTMTIGAGRRAFLREAIRPRAVSIWTQFKHCCAHNYKSVFARHFLNIVFQVVKSFGIG